MDLNTLKEKKKQTKMTLQEISEKSNIPINTLKNIFSERTKNPRIDTINAIESALGVNTVEFTEEEKVLGVGNHGTKLSNEEWEWLELYSLLKENCSPETVNAVKTLISTFIEQK
jgi:transcriptional regulator with XRE-family HTH domain